MIDFESKIEIAEYVSFTSQQIHFTSLLEESGVEFHIEEVGIVGESASELFVTKFFINQSDFNVAIRLKNETNKIDNNKIYRPFIKKGFAWLFFTFIVFILICFFLIQ